MPSLRPATFSAFALAVAFVLGALVVLGALPIAPASAAGPACVTTSPSSSYAVSICITEPAEAASLTGIVQTTVTITSTGSPPAISRVITTLDGAALLTDVQAPYTFELPTYFFADGAHSLEATAQFSDGRSSGVAGVNLSFFNPGGPPAVTPFAPSSGTTPSEGQPFVVAFVGDGAGGRTSATQVSDRIVTMDPNLFLYLGDVYEKGTQTEFYNHYGKYDATPTLFARLRSITNPVVGNHEYEANLAPGYFAYWGDVPNYYSFNAGGWHFIALNSTSQFNQRDVGTPQYNWLVNDLASNAGACIAVYFHHPIYSIGPQGDTTALQPMWQLLAQAGVKLVLTGHEHSYQRWVALDGVGNPSPTGVTEIVAGSGGHGIQAFVRTDPRVAASFDSTTLTPGAGKLSLTSSGADFQFVNQAGTVLDSTSIPCLPDSGPPTAPANLHATNVSSTSVAMAWSPSSDDRAVAGYRIFRDGAQVAEVPPTSPAFMDGGLASGASYAYAVRAFDPVDNVSEASNVLNVTTVLATTLTLNATQDSLVSSDTPDTNFGTQSTMKVDTSPTIRSYVRFDATDVAGPILAATLRVKPLTTLAKGFAVQDTSSTWAETTISYNNAPAFGPQLATSGPVTAGQYVDIDVTGAVTAHGARSFALTGLSSTSISISSRESASEPQLILVVQTSANTPPTAGDLTLGVDQNAVNAPWIPVVSDAETPTALACVIAAPPLHGAATVLSDCSSGTYTPTSGYSGADSFTYQASDGTLTDTGVVSITVTVPPTAPVAGVQLVTTQRDTALPITLTATDANGDCPLAFSASTAPAHGSLGSITNPQCTNGSATASVTYTPAAGYTGSDSFTFTATDPGARVSSPATVTITVSAPPATITLNPVADSYVRDTAPTTNFGTSTTMRVDGASPVEKSYLRFNVTGIAGAPTSVKLRVFANSSLNAGFQVLRLSDNAWTETGLTYQNAPVAGIAINNSSPVASGAYIEIDVASYVTANGTYSFVLAPLSNTGLSLGTKESANKPQLVITQ